MKRFKFDQTTVKEGLIVYMNFATLHVEAKENASRTIIAISKIGFLHIGTWDIDSEQATVNFTSYKSANKNKWLVD